MVSSGLEPGTFNTAQTRKRRSNQLSHELSLQTLLLREIKRMKIVVLPSCILVPINTLLNTNRKHILYKKRNNRLECEGDGQWTEERQGRWWRLSSVANEEATRGCRMPSIEREWNPTLAWTYIHLDNAVRSTPAQIDKSLSGNVRMSVNCRHSDVFVPSHTRVNVTTVHWPPYPPRVWRFHLLLEPVTDYLPLIAISSRHSSQTILSPS